LILRLLRSLQPQAQPCSGRATTPGAATAALHADLGQQLRENERIWLSFRRLELAMLNAGSLREVVEVLVRLLPEAFPAVQAVSVAWLDENSEAARLLQEQGGGAAAGAFVSLPVLQDDLHPARAQLGPITPAVQAALFPGNSRTLRSMAIVPLRLRGQLAGCLNQASEDPRHFTADASTDLLEHLAAVVAICIDNSLNRARLQRDGLTDVLTDVANRRLFDRRLQEEISQWTRRGGRLACLLVDLDHFKQINDRFGHLTGDRALQQVARVLSTGLRFSDVLARYGGEEFVLLLPDTDSRHALEIAERLRAAVPDTVRLADDGQVPAVTVSIGIACLESGMASAPVEPHEWLLRRADEALYAAKARGRNRVVLLAEGE
jgi:diguanylate cyclase (GGDEF)-like protein